MKRLSRLDMTERLALAALLLGAGAAFADPTAGPILRVNAQELAVIVQRGADRVAPFDLATWIIESRPDYRLIDVRERAHYARYHIPTSENIPLTSLPAADFAPTEKLLLYADDGAASAQAWFLLRARGFKGVYVLAGGLDAWKHEVLFPVLAAGADPASNARLQAISRHFGGAPRVVTQSATAVGAAPDPPTLDVTNLPPPPPAAASGGRTKPKRKEGC